MKKTYFSPSLTLTTLESYQFLAVSNVDGGGLGYGGGAGSGEGQRTQRFGNWIDGESSANLGEDW